MVSLSYIFGVGGSVLGISLIVAVPAAIIILLWIRKKRFKKAYEESMKGGFNNGKDQEDKLRQSSRGSSNRRGLEPESNGRGIKSDVEQSRGVQVSKDNIRSQASGTDSKSESDTDETWPEFE